MLQPIQGRGGDTGSSETVWTGHQTKPDELEIQYVWTKYKSAQNESIQ